MQETDSSRKLPPEYQEQKAFPKHVPEESNVAGGISTEATERVHSVHKCVCTCPVQERGGYLSCFHPLLFPLNFYKYDRSYKMLSHLKFHSILFFLFVIIEKTPQ